MIANGTIRRAPASALFRGAAALEPIADAPRIHAATAIAANRKPPMV